MPVARDLNGSIPASEAIRPVPPNEKNDDIDDETIHLKFQRMKKFMFLFILTTHIFII